MIRGVWRRVVRFLGSSGLATTLLAILGVWSILASLVPQGVASKKEVAVWAVAHPIFEGMARFLGLHQAYANPVFVALAFVLGVSTSICAWSRTKAALHRAGTLHRAMSTDAEALAENHDLEVVCDEALSASEALSVAETTLKHLGVKTRQKDEVLVAVSPRWTTLGSPIFHWALLGLLVALLVGNLLRASGLMGVQVGETVADAAQSYGVLHTGPLHDWGRVHRGIRVDSFEINYRTAGVDRGPTPTVTLVDAKNRVIKSQRVYPNHTLKSGSLTIYPSSFGLAVTVSELDAKKAVVGRGSQLVDFSSTAASGTVPVGGIAVLGPSGKPVYRAAMTVPLDPQVAGMLNQVPRSPTVHVVVTSMDGKTVVMDRVVHIGDVLDIAGADSLLVENVDYYARLQVVDDWTVPLLYAGFVLALLGLAVATLARQQIVLVTAVDGPDGVRLVARIRFWRNSSTSRSEIENELTSALAGVDKGSTT